MTHGSAGETAAVCAICGAGALHEIAEFAALTRVTSDSRTVPPGGRLTVCMQCGTIQKIPDEKWRAEIAAIYAEFELDHQAGGEEQVIFDSAGLGLPRSQRIVDFIAASEQVAAPSQVLDFGCGRGATLKVLARHWPGAALYGAELSDATEAELRAIPAFRKLYTAGPDMIDQRFDLVLFVHSLAHIVGPVEVLRKMHSRMLGDGTLLIQTPDAAKNPFYILVADAVTHFTPEALRQAAAHAGFAEATMAGIAPNEITYLGRRAAAPVSPPGAADPAQVLAGVRGNVVWLGKQIAAARRLADQRPSLGIFGSSLAGSWLAAEIGGRFDFFVDEDPLRLGTTHMGRPIVGIDSIPANAAVFIPLAPNVARIVAERLAGRGIDCRMA
jgi:SAM-dependent methyltransferase